MFQVLELPDDFYPTDMHWIPRGGGGAPGNQHQPPDNQLMETGRFLSGKKAGGGSDLFLLTSATGRLQLVTQCETRSLVLKIGFGPLPAESKNLQNHINYDPSDLLFGPQKCLWSTSHERCGLLFQGPGREGGIFCFFYSLTTI